MVVFETINSTCGILVPYATGQVIKAVTQAHEQSLALVAGLKGPLWLFVGLSIGEVIFSRAGGRCQIVLGPRQRQTVTRALYAYLQHHSHRYLSNDFAGALAHRISETSLGVSQTLWTVIFDFYRELFGWQKADAQTDPANLYQLFSAGGQTVGGVLGRADRDAPRVRRRKTREHIVVGRQQCARFGYESFPVRGES